MRLPGKGGGIYYFFLMTIESRVFEERTRRSEGVIHKGRVKKLQKLKSDSESQAKAVKE